MHLAWLAWLAWLGDMVVSPESRHTSICTQTTTATGSQFMQRFLGVSFGSFVPFPSPLLLSLLPLFALFSSSPRSLSRDFFHHQFAPITPYHTYAMPIPIPRPTLLHPFHSLSTQLLLCFVSLRALRVVPSVSNHCIPYCHCVINKYQPCLKQQRLPYRHSP